MWFRTDDWFIQWFHQTFTSLPSVYKFILLICGPELISYLAHKYNTSVGQHNIIWNQINLGLDEVQMFQSKSHTCGELTNVHKFENIGHSDPVPLMCLAPVPMHICV